MKLLIRITTVVCLFVFFTACQEDFLNELNPENDNYSILAPSNWEFDWEADNQTDNRESWPGIGLKAPNQRRAAGAINKEGKILVIAYEGSQLVLRLGELIKEKDTEKVLVNWMDDEVIVGSVGDRLYNSVSLNNKGKFVIAFTISSMNRTLLGRAGNIDGGKINISERFGILATNSLMRDTRYGGNAIVTDDDFIIAVASAAGAGEDKVYGALGRFKDDNINTEWVSPSGWKDHPYVSTLGDEGRFEIKAKGRKQYARISVVKNDPQSNHHDRPVYDLLLTTMGSGDGAYHWGRVAYHDDGKIGTTDSEDIKNRFRWRPKNSLIYNRRHADGIAFAQSGINFNRGTPSTTVDYLGRRRVLISYDNSNRQGRVIEAEWKINETRLAWPAGGNSNDNMHKITVKGGISRIHALPVPIEVSTNLFGDTTPRALLLYHSINKDENEDVNKIKYNFWKF